MLGGGCVCGSIYVGWWLCLWFNTCWVVDVAVVQYMLGGGCVCGSIHVGWWMCLWFNICWVVGAGVGVVQYMLVGGCGDGSVYIEQWILDYRLLDGGCRITVFKIKF